MGFDIKINLRYLIIDNKIHIMSEKEIIYKKAEEELDQLNGEYKSIKNL